MNPLRIIGKDGIAIEIANIETSIITPSYINTNTLTIDETFSPNREYEPLRLLKQAFVLRTLQPVIRFADEPYNKNIAFMLIKINNTDTT